MSKGHTGLARRGELAAIAVIAFASLSSGGPDAAIVGPPDRNTVAEWADRNGLDLAAVEARYAASGVVTCAWTDANDAPRASIASGQLTGASDILTLSGHTFRDPLTCEAKAGPSDCQFTTRHDGVVETVTISEIIDVGIACGEGPTSYSDRILNDWAIARLEHPLDIAPYALPDSEVPIAEGATVLSVVHSQDYLLVDPGRDMFHPKTIGECTVRDLMIREDRPIYFTSDCDGAQRSSGGAILDDTGPVPALLGVWVANTEEAPMLFAAVRRVIDAGGYQHRLVNNGQYSVNFWSSRHIPLDGVFLAALRAAVD